MLRRLNNCIHGYLDKNDLVRFGMMMVLSAPGVACVSQTSHPFIMVGGAVWLFLTAFSRWAYLVNL